jgi:hypothetical protein
MEPVPLRGRPGTKPLPLTNKRAVGGPIALGLLAAYMAVALAGWVATAGALVWAAPDLAAGSPLARGPVLATHLFGLGVLAFAVTGAAFHLVPVMLRNDVRHPGRLRVAPALLAGGFVLAPGIAFDRDALVWIGAGLSRPDWCSCSPSCSGSSSTPRAGGRWSPAAPASRSPACMSPPRSCSARSSSRATASRSQGWASTAGSSST